MALFGLNRDSNKILRESSKDSNGYITELTDLNKQLREHLIQYLVILYSHGQSTYIPASLQDANIPLDLFPFLISKFYHEEYKENGRNYKHQSKLFDTWNDKKIASIATSGIYLCKCSVTDIITNKSWYPIISDKRGVRKDDPQYSVEHTGFTIEGAINNMDDIVFGSCIIKFEDATENMPFTIKMRYRTTKDTTEAGLCIESENPFISECEPLIDREHKKITYLGKDIFGDKYILTALYEYFLSEQKESLDNTKTDEYSKPSPNDLLSKINDIYAKYYDTSIEEETPIDGDNNCEDIYTKRVYNRCKTTLKLKDKKQTGKDLAKRISEMNETLTKAGVPHFFHVRKTVPNDQTKYIIPYYWIRRKF